MHMHMLHMHMHMHMTCACAACACACMFGAVSEGKKIVSYIDTHSDMCMLRDVTCYMHMHMHVHVHAHVYRGLHEAANSESKLQYECCSDPACCM